MMADRELLKKSFAARNLSEQKLIAQQPRPVPKLMKDSSIANGRPRQGSYTCSQRFVYIEYIDIFNRPEVHTCRHPRLQ